MKQLKFTALRTTEIVDAPEPSAPLAPSEVRGRTVVSLVSPGTEINGGFLGSNFPWTPGYACVFEVAECGADVTDLRAGTLVYCGGPHRSHQSFDRSDVLPLPEGLAPETAVFARLCGVSMSTLNTTKANPPARVLVSGLGPVGNLAAQIFAICGYTVTAADPVESRRNAALHAGLRDLRPSLSEGVDDLVDQVLLHVECSGHEQAVLDGCRLVRRGGELVLVGTPWKRRTEIFAQELLMAVFKKFVVLRSGWEWEVPKATSDFEPHSLMANYAAAMNWLRDGRLNVDGMASVHSPLEAQALYTAMADMSFPMPAAIFDWRRL